MLESQLNVQSVSTRNQRAFDASVVALRPALSAFARRFHANKTDADDLVQETLFKAFRARNQFIPDSNMKSWLFTIMRNYFNTDFKAKRKEPVTADSLLDLLGASPPQQDWYLYSQDVDRIIKRMPATQRLALLQISAGISYEEAAISLDCEVGTIKSRVSRARRTLKVEMGDIFISRESYAH